MTKVIITVKGGNVQSVHSNKPIQYVVVDDDMEDNDKVSQITREDSNLSDYFDVLDSFRKKMLLDDLINSNNDFDELEYAKQILAKWGYVKHFWHTDDIIQVADQNDTELTDEQINDVVSKLEDIDCNIGINWDTISIAINDVIEKKED